MTAVAAPTTLPPSLRALGRHRAPARRPRLAVAAAVLAAAAALSLTVSGGVTTRPTESALLSAASQTVTTGLGPVGRSGR
ncbi:hypothetical protein [Cryptosporangium sp. NPDC051539]|uniref:hypothetical protein n=1 Tax=Cryptosporangium sp. NPDC051539 TaxID=3363962 RepID=UPI0037981577